MYGVSYFWSGSGDTSGTTRYEAAFAVAINAADFRGDLDFVYYHQTLYDVTCADSAEITYGGRAAGGYAVTLHGAGFESFDGNPKTVRVRFGEPGGGPLDGNGKSADVVADAITSSTIVVTAPEVSLDKGDRITSDDFPCFVPPCRRVLLSVALNGVDFVGGADDDEVEFYFFKKDPWRAFNLLQREAFLYLFGLVLVCLGNLAVSWHFRYDTYDRYLALKYKLKNKLIYPMMYGE